MEQAEFTGEVVKAAFGTGSKSEHEAVYLETETGRYVLRRQTGNPFYDPVLEQLVGETIRCKGFVTGYTLLITDYEVVK